MAAMSPVVKRSDGQTFQSDTQDLRTHVDALPDGRLKVAMMHTVFPDADADAKADDAVAAPVRRRGSVVPMHAFTAALAHVKSASMDVALALDLGGFDIGCDGALSLAELMRSKAMARLRHLDLSSNKLTDLGQDFKGIQNIASALEQNTVLTSLNLARNSLYKHGAGAVARALRNNKCLEFLDLSRNNLRAPGIIAIAKAISPANNPMSALTTLDLSQNNATNFNETTEGTKALASAIVGHKTLTCLNLSHSRLHKTAVMAIAGALRNNHSLVDLRLDDNSIDPGCAQAIAASLEENHTLTRLGLFANRILTDGAVALARALRDNPVLHEMDLRSNYIGSEGRLAVARLLCPEDPAVIKALAEDEAEKASARARFQPHAAAKAKAEAEAAAAAAAAAGEEEGEEETKGADGAEETKDGGAAAEAPAIQKAPPTPSKTKTTAAGGLDLSADEVVFASKTTGQVVYM